MANSNGVITLNSENSREVELEIAATGNFTIIWGDGTNEQFTGDGTYLKYIK